MTPLRLSLIGSLLLAACATTGPDGLTDSERDIKENVDKIPIEAVRISDLAREEMRRAGRPVMTVLGTPAHLYRDYARTKGNIRTRVHLPQETPDVQGCVVVSYDVLPDGKTDGFEIESSTPPGVFDRAALRAALATEYEPAVAPRPRQRRAMWFLIARPPRPEISRINEVVEADRNRRRDEQRVACEGPAS